MRFIWQSILSSCHWSWFFFSYLLIRIFNIFSFSCHFRVHNDKLTADTSTNNRSTFGNIIVFDARILLPSTKAIFFLNIKFTSYMNIDDKVNVADSFWYCIRSICWIRIESWNRVYEKGVSIATLCLIEWTSNPFGNKVTQQTSYESLNNNTAKNRNNTRNTLKIVKFLQCISSIYKYICVCLWVYVYWKQPMGV